ncbi:hypothetical protein LC087_03715 [Bacillus carboniphilus]|uniref:Uncharacterized protein n=1 Tax=Bacillus carboniphilus TaxID=86663 RepID=A0ABY9JXQ5_9BACI|nr:hypothetical protein [Bacillus carboniphilus]WLR43307.1 hypothetical protein LC087_03715 [Bacillus carboniphilus]
MNSLQDVFYNWLSIKLVTDQWPHDQAAVDTERLFAEMLKEQFAVSNISINRGVERYDISFQKENEDRSYSFPIELVEATINQMKKHPDKFIDE